MTNGTHHETHDGAMEKLSTMGTAWKIIDPATRRRMALLFLRCCQLNEGRSQLNV